MKKTSVYDYRFCVKAHILVITSKAKLSQNSILKKYINVENGREKSL